MFPLPCFADTQQCQLHLHFWISSGAVSSEKVLSLDPRRSVWSLHVLPVPPTVQKHKCSVNCLSGSSLCDCLFCVSVWWTSDRSKVAHWLLKTGDVWWLYLWNLIPMFLEHQMHHVTTPVLQCFSPATFGCIFASSHLNPTGTSLAFHPVS